MAALAAAVLVGRGLASMVLRMRGVTMGVRMVKVIEQGREG
jgi:hypothetical protein